MPDTPLSPKEQQKLSVIQRAIKRELTNAQAAKMLEISTRQVKRLKKKLRIYGSGSVSHQLRGKPSNHHLPPEVKEKALQLVREHYADFKPTFASEKLEERHGISINPQTLRRWMATAGLWKTRKQKQAQYHAWRPRKEYYGELQQFDGSYHFWFEERFVDEDGQPIEVCLLASIDDATGEITKAQFAENEGVIAVFTFWKWYVEETGKPLGIYLDRFSTYKVNHRHAVDNHDLLTQFQRAMQELAIDLITAHSAEAKGRVERLFETLQDRLCKEMRLASINTPEEGNKFLKEVFLPSFNKRFSVIAAKEGNIHRVLSVTDKKYIHRTFSVQATRKVNNDFTIQFKNHWYQLTELQPTTVRAKDTVLVEEWLDQTLHISLRGYYLVYVILPQRPQKLRKRPLILTSHKLNWKPPKDHPWRKPFKQRS